MPPTSTCTGVCENYVKKNDREKKAKGLSPHARDNQLQVGSSGGPIRPLVAEILIFYLSSAGRENRCSSFLRSADGNEEDWVARRDRTVLTHKKYSIVRYGSYAEYLPLTTKFFFRRNRVRRSSYPESFRQTLGRESSVYPRYMWKHVCEYAMPRLLKYELSR